MNTPFHPPWIEQAHSLMKIAFIDSYPAAVPKNDLPHRRQVAFCSDIAYENYPRIAFRSSSTVVMGAI